MTVTTVGNNKLRTRKTPGNRRIGSIYVTCNSKLPCSLQHIPLNQVCAIDERTLIFIQYEFTQSDAKGITVN